jgi:Immunoglobulin I-set domain
MKLSTSHCFVVFSLEYFNLIRKMLLLVSLVRFKDNVKLTPSSRTTMERNGNEYRLVINQVVQQDKGQYTARATNSEGTTEAVATLTVEGNVMRVKINKGVCFT